MTVLSNFINVNSSHTFQTSLSTTYRTAHCALHLNNFYSPNPLELCSHNVVLPQPLQTSGTVYQNTSDSVVN